MNPWLMAYLAGVCLFGFTLLRQAFCDRDTHVARGAVRLTLIVCWPLWLGAVVLWVLIAPGRAIEWWNSLVLQIRNEAIAAGRPADVVTRKTQRLIIGR
jgi:hypothetical protein